MERKNGFTLAEVLITLAIIGVVAAMTIPTLLQNQAKQQYVTSLKKSYTQFNQALQQLTNNYGCVQDLNCTGVYITDSDVTTFGDAITQYFKIAKNCKTTNPGCFVTDIKFNIDGSGSTQSLDDTNKYRFITVDGISFSLEDLEGYNCVNGEAAKGDNFSQICGQVFVDVNGPKRAPNTFGRDIFIFYITNGRGAMLFPRGGQGDAYAGSWKDYSTSTINQCDNATGKMQGNSCAGRIMDEGWQMNY